MAKMNSFAVISQNYVLVTASMEELQAALIFWPEAPAEVFATESIAEANFAASQCYARRFYSHPECFKLRPLPLPATGCYAVKAPETASFPRTDASLLPPVAVAPDAEYSLSTTNCLAAEPGNSVTFEHRGPLTRGGAWSVVGANGYAVAESIENVTELLGNAFIFGHATWWANPQHAILWAQREYSERFSRCFNIREFRPVLPSRPLLPGEMCKDEDFDDKFTSQAENPIFQKLRRFGVF